MTARASERFHLHSYHEGNHCSIKSGRGSNDVGIGIYSRHLIKRSPAKRDKVEGATLLGLSALESIQELTPLSEVK